MRFEHLPSALIADVDTLSPDTTHYLPQQVFKFDVILFSPCYVPFRKGECTRKIVFCFSVFLFQGFQLRVFSFMRTLFFNKKKASARAEGRVYLGIDATVLIVVLLLSFIDPMYHSVNYLIFYF